MVPNGDRHHVLRSLIILHSCFFEEVDITARMGNIVQKRKKVNDGNRCQSTWLVKSMDTICFL